MVRFRFANMDLSSYGVKLCSEILCDSPSVCERKVIGLHLLEPQRVSDKMMGWTHAEREG